jgi:predicted permease
MGLLLKSGLHGDVLQAAGIAVLAVSTVLLVGGWRAQAGGGLATPSLLLGSCIGNTAYFGVPLALAFLPPEALTITIGYDLGATLLTWSVGPQLLGGAATSRWLALRQLLVSMASSPATRGLVGALVIQATPWRAAISEGLWWPSRIVVVLALMVVGMRLGSLTRQGKPPRLLGVGLAPALVTKLLLYPLLLLLLGSLFGLDPLKLQALALQGAAPTAISILLIAESVGRDQERAAALVFWSTVFAVLTAPIWGLVLQVLV